MTSTAVQLLLSGSIVGRERERVFCGPSISPTSNIEKGEKEKRIVLAGVSVQEGRKGEGLLEEEEKRDREK